jgi:hypothetical protein
MAGYTLAMKTMFWLVIAAAIAVIAYLIRHLLQKHAERAQAEEARAAAFLAQMAGAKPAAPPEPQRPAAPAAASPSPPAPAVSNALAQQKLLFGAARSAGDAGEPVLAVQLYGRLLARYPDSAFAAEARAAAQALKNKVLKS